LIEYPRARVNSQPALIAEQCVYMLAGVPV
jgi:hypothetical protein